MNQNLEEKGTTQDLDDVKNILRDTSKTKLIINKESKTKLSGVETSENPQDSARMVATKKHGEAFKDVSDLVSTEVNSKIKHRVWILGVTGLYFLASTAWILYLISNQKVSDTMGYWLITGMFTQNISLLAIIYKFEFSPTESFLKTFTDLASQLLRVSEDGEQKQK